MSLTPDALNDCSGHKALVIEPYYYSPKLETAFEISEILAQANDVTFAGPDVLRCTTDETYRFHGRSAIRYSRKRFASTYLTAPVRKLSRPAIAEVARRPSVAETAAYLEMCDTSPNCARLGNFDLGMGLRSSLISLTRDASVALSDHRRFAFELARDAVMLYRVAKDLIERERYDLVVLFNGRFAPVRGIRRACEELGIRYFVHERGSSREKYAIYDCAIPHQPRAYRNWVDTWWGYSDRPEENAQTFLASRRHGITTNWFSYTRKQTRGSAPPRSDQKRVSFFTSSDDEFLAIGDELASDTPFCDQGAAVRSLGAACRERGFELVVRFHPNTAASATSLMQTAREAGAVVVKPLDPIDSYALLDSSDIVISQNSTIAVEAAAIGKPTFYTGRSIYEACDSIRRIKTEADIRAALEFTGSTDPLDALRYANFISTHGINYAYYEPSGLFTGRYKSKDLNLPLSKLIELRFRILRGSK